MKQKLTLGSCIMPEMLNDYDLTKQAIIDLEQNNRNKSARVVRAWLEEACGNGNMDFLPPSADLDAKAQTDNLPWREKRGLRPTKNLVLQMHVSQLTEGMSSSRGQSVEAWALALEAKADSVERTHLDTVTLLSANKATHNR